MSIFAVSIDGQALDPRDARISVFDWGLMRGDGCFEAIRVYDGEAFAVAEHLDRLERSAAALRLELPDRDAIADWVLAAATAAGTDCDIRILVTRGNPDLPEVPSRVVVLAETLPVLGDTLRVLPVVAPWHGAGRTWSLEGVKSLSYAPNLASSRQAREAGFDDAILTSVDHVVLEGPTFSIGWFVDGVLETPGLELSLLDSITRRHALAAAATIGMTVREGSYPLDRMLAADEVMAMSTIKEVMPVVAVGETTFAPGPRTAELGAAFRLRVVEDLVRTRP